MAKPPVLGNDPFQRGAAPRTEAPKPEAKAPEAPKAKPTKPAAKSQKVAKPAAKVAAAPAKPAGKPVVKAAKAPAKPVTKVAAAPAKPAGKPAPKPAAKKVEPAPAKPVSKPAPKAVSPAKPAKKQEKKPAAKKQAAEPAPTPVEPVAEPTVVREPAKPAPSKPPVIEGEIVDEYPPRTRTLVVSEPEPSYMPPPPTERRPGRMEQLRRSAISAFEVAAQGLFTSVASSRVARRLAAVPGADRVASFALNTAVPVFETFRAALPPTVGAARAAASSVVSGNVLGEAGATVSDAVETVRRVRRRSEPSTFEFDLFGEDPHLLSRLEPIFDFLHERWFRVEVHGADQVPEGPCLVVCNHAGFLPIDGPMMRTVLRRECGRNDARWLVEDSIFQAPFLGTWLNRLGAVRACPENAERLLAEQTAVVVFPEGVLGAGKTVLERYRLQRFGRGGFVKLAMRAGVPVVPAAIVGAEDSSPLLARLPLRALGRALPITPTFPWLGPLGLVPLPAKWQVSFLPPVDLSRHGPKGAEDLALVGRVTEEVRGAVQDEIDRLLASRS